MSRGFLTPQGLGLGLRPKLRSNAPGFGLKPKKLCALIGPVARDAPRKSSTMEPGNYCTCACAYSAT